MFPNDVSKTDVLCEAEKREPRACHLCETRYTMTRNLNSIIFQEFNGVEGPRSDP